MQTAPLTIEAMISRAQPNCFARIRIKHPSVGLQENTRLKMTTETVTYAENFHGVFFIQWHRVVICIWCALFVTSQFDVIVLFPNQRFGEVC